MADAPPPARLDSWKAIAEYLQRDVATVRRWEKALALPVRRVPGGRGHSVFAFTPEIDAWLKTAPAASGDQRIAGNQRVWFAAVVAIVAAMSITWAMATRARVKPSELRLDVTPDGAVAFDGAGRERWRYNFRAGYKAAPSATDDSWRVDEGAPPAVFVASTYLARRSDRAIEGGMLTWLDLNGVAQRTFSFDDHVSVGGRMFGPPWGVNTFAIDDSRGTRRIAVAGHHFTWNPGLVTVLDSNWKRSGTFVNDGWIETVRWISPNRLLVSGFSNAHDGGMLALLDADALGGQGPEKPGTPSYCDSCSTGTPLRMVIMPRTEINRVTASPFNHALMQITSGRITARTIEVPSAGQEAVDALYEFTPTLDLVSASFSDRYWEVHRALEAQGKIDHAREACPDRDGPPEIQIWDRASGWATIHAPGATRAPR